MGNSVKEVQDGAVQHLVHQHFQGFTVEPRAHFKFATLSMLLLLKDIHLCIKHGRRDREISVD